MSVLLTTFSVCVKIPLKKWKINSISFVHVKGTKYKNNNSRNNDKIIIIKIIILIIKIIIIVKIILLIKIISITREGNDFARYS